MQPHTPDLKGEGLRIAIVWSRFNEEIVRQLLTACDKQLVELGVAADDIYVMSVPGALEIPARAADARARAARLHAALRCARRPRAPSVRGETYHFEVVANESARGILDVQLETGVPVANGVLTVSTDDQARARASVKARRRRAWRSRWRTA
jgi:6,7-dimethyl-8-ribityllumazine synthase